MFKGSNFVKLNEIISVAGNLEYHSRSNQCEIFVSNNFNLCHWIRRCLKSFYFKLCRHFVQWSRTAILADCTMGTFK